MCGFPIYSTQDGGVGDIHDSSSLEDEEIVLVLLPLQQLRLIAAH